MAGFLLTYLMECLQKSPDRVFGATNLSDRAEPGEIEDLVRRNILIPSAGRGSAGDPLSYTVDLGVIAKAIAKVQKLKAPSEPVRLDPRLVFLGTFSTKGELYASFLALAEVDEEVAALIERKGGAYVEVDRFVAVTAKEPVRATTRQSELREKKIEFVTLGELGLTEIRNEAVRRKRLAAPTTVVDAALEREIASFPSRKRIDIPGEWAQGHYSREGRTDSGATLNSFKVNGETKNVGDALFLFLLRLVVGLFEARESGGYVRNSDFDVYEASLHLTARELDGQVSRLRQHLRGSVEDVKQFIDRTKRGHTRLGVHPALITFDRTKLMTHPNAAINRLAERLPAQQ